MLKRTAGLIIACSLGSFAFGAYAETPIQKIEAYLRPDYQVVINGHPAALAKPPILYEDRTYLPVGLLAPLLNVDVNWDEKSKTIYLIPRVTGQPAETASSEVQTMPEIKLGYAQVYMVSYLGGTYPVLCDHYNGAEYYRVKDLARMGIDPNVLQKVKEKFTGDLYVTKEEMNTFLKDPNAGWSQVYSPVVTGEKDEAKIQVLKDFPNMLQQANQALAQSGISAPTYDLFYTIDSTDEPNTYLFLCYEDTQFYEYKVTLYSQTTNVNGEDKVNWFLSGYNKIDIQAGDTSTTNPYGY